VPTRLFLFLALGQIEVKKVWFFIGLLATTTTTQQFCRQAETQCKIKKGKFMIPQLFVESIDLGDGRSITIETGRLAKQADGSVVVRIGKTVILGTVVAARKASPGIDFFTINGRLS